MPTGGKLIAALAFAALAYFVTDLVKPLLPEGTQVGKFSEINALVGLVMGWTIMGKGAGKSMRQSLGYGLTTLVATVFWCLVVQDMAQLAIDYARLAAVKAVIWPAVIGAIFMAWLTDFFARRWS